MGVDRAHTFQEIVHSGSFLRVADRRHPDHVFTMSLQPCSPCSLPPCTLTKIPASLLAAENSVLARVGNSPLRH